MPSVFAKLNLTDQREIVVLNAPASFEPELAALSGVSVVRDAKAAKSIAFFLAFVMTQQEADVLAKVAARKTQGDAVIWFAYAKGTSKTYRSAVNRDNGWDVLRAAGFEPVRSVAIDADWSALRFRRSEFVKR